MEQPKEQASDVNPRKLDLNLPLLSTRRHGDHSGEENSCAANSQAILQDASDRIPFCWEQAPGRPKDGIERVEIHEGDTPRPRLPPCRRWYQRKEESNISRAKNFTERDDGCDADVDDDYDHNNDDDNDFFSDAIEMLSLTEAIDIAQKAEDECGSDRLDFESGEYPDNQSPNFMIERFLPDATALAASSVVFASQNRGNKLSYSWSFTDRYGSGKGCSSEPTQKGCGLEIFLPWRMKHKLCGVKSPVKRVLPNIESHSGWKQKKHHS